MEAHSMKTFHDLLYKDGNPFIKDMFKYGDRDALQLYGFWAAAGALGNIYEEYSRIFGLCRLLGGMNVYDIGCGWNYQACLLIHRYDMTYTGIDADEHFDYDRMNGVFAESYGNRIRFFCAHYPCPLTILPGNAAIARRWRYRRGSLSNLKRFAASIVKDFDRLITTWYYEEYDREDMLKFWEEEMPGFRAVPLGDEELILATKIPEDFAKMEEVNYKYGNSAFAIRPH